MLTNSLENNPGIGIKDLQVQSFFPAGCSGQSFASKKTHTNLPALLARKKGLLSLHHNKGN